MDKRQKDLITQLKKEKIPVLAVGLITNKQNNPDFFEVILDRKFRYASKENIKKVRKFFLESKLRLFST